MDDPDPIREVVTTSESGMQESEVWEHFVVHTEHQEVQAEKREENQNNVPDVNNYGQRR
jgi:hypothetical protein